MLFFDEDDDDDHVYILHRNLRRWIAHKTDVAGAASVSGNVWAITQPAQQVKNIRLVTLPLVNHVGQVRLRLPTIKSENTGREVP